MTLVLLPAVYLDDIAGDDNAARPALVNRNPEPDEIQVPADQHIWLDLVDVGAAGIDSSATIIEIEGQEAFNGGAFVPPYTGNTWPLTSPGAGGPDGLRIEIIPPANWDSLAEIEIRVVSDLIGGGFPFDESFQFTIEDLTPPEVLTAEAIDQDRVRVTFDEPVRALGDGDPLDALTASSYSFEAIHDDITPAVPIEAAIIWAIDSQVFDVELNWEMSPGVQYRLTVSDVADVWGNPIGTSEAIFDSYTPQLPAGRDFDLYRMMPLINREEDQTLDLLRFLNSMQEAFNLLLLGVDRWIDIIDVDRAGEDFVDAMLADLGNPFLFDLDLTQKRKLVRVLVEIYKLKGTAPGIVNALRFFLGTESEVLEYADEEAWILGVDELGIGTYLGLDDQRALYSFDVRVDRSLTADERSLLRALVDYMKPAHTHHIKTIEP